MEVYAITRKPPCKYVEKKSYFMCDETINLQALIHEKASIAFNNRSLGVSSCVSVSILTTKVISLIL